MRTTQRDQGSVITVSGRLADAASGAGVMWPGGIPYVFTRAATGQYQLYFDTRIFPLSFEGMGDAAVGGVYVRTWGWSPGTVVLVQNASSTNAATNGSFSFAMTALDKRL